MATYTNSRIQLRIDTESNWNTNHPNIEAGEICFSSDKKDFVVGTGTPWAPGNYWIANNPTVTSIRTTANNAASSASSAMNRANQAYSIAQAAAQSAGRVVNIDVLKDAISNQQSISITAAFLKEHQNTDFIAPEMSMATANEIDINEVGDINDTTGNIVTFAFHTGEVVYIKSALFSIAPGAGKVMVIAGNDASAPMYDKSETITIPAGYIVECQLINNYMLKYTTTKWS